MSKNLLIVDDSMVSRMMTKSIIANLQPRWNIFEAGSGQAAIELCREQSIELISMDLNMPGLSGLEAATLILLEHPHIKIVMLTANVQTAIQSQIQDLGLPFLAKPITADKGPALLKALGD
ncbi:response regulator transcription factor [Pseudomonas sp. 5P_3.1_Bac2]|uniref:response regulator transcription factor n=1 Tax=Pseudomonas sp. 5P_3.1_Bac2 TaxID=2971617 RepID=UPI0021CA8E48|nr:response regulator [Pseudomonas sp. 5P_3.1_Bac2]MCU1719416.1 response regulator [Pseudomonas sp. 5P_3.1_Bac2]